MIIIIMIIVIIIMMMMMLMIYLLHPFLQWLFVNVKNISINYCKYKKHDN